MKKQEEKQAGYLGGTTLRLSTEGGDHAQPHTRPYSKLVIVNREGTTQLVIPQHIGCRVTLSPGDYFKPEDFFFLFFPRRFN